MLKKYRFVGRNFLCALNIAKVQINRYHQRILRLVREKKSVADSILIVALRFENFFVGKFLGGVHKTFGESVKTANVPEHVFSDVAPAKQKLRSLFQHVERHIFRAKRRRAKKTVTHDIA